LKSYLERNPLLYPPEPSGDAGKAGHFAIIPVYDENAHIYSTLASVKTALIRSPEPVKVILVLNEPANAPAGACQRNRELLASLQKNDGKYDGGLSVGRELFFINLLDKEIKTKFRTVGNARKCGFDGALHQIDGQVTDQNSLLFSLDADTLVSPDYFISALQYFRLHPELAGAVFDFEHRLSGIRELDLAAMRYEIYLRDYSCKLKNARSEYWFWTIGSAFACTARDYMRCGGMRRHAAGEDFYFLQALRKVGRIGVVPDCRVYPAGRVSDRVPFGTGPAIARQLQGEMPELYNPDSFELLKAFFLHCETLEYDQLTGAITGAAETELQEFFQTLDFDCIWAKIVRNTPRCREKLLEALHIYCDGFFIIKFCHWLEQQYPGKFARQKMFSDELLAEKLHALRQECALLA